MADQNQKLPFFYGSSIRPAPIGQFTYDSGAAQQFIKVTKSGFLLRLRHTFVGTVTLSSASGSGPIPAHLLINNYQVQNSLGFAYRNLTGAGAWFANQLYTQANVDPVLSGPFFAGAKGTVSSQPLAFVLEDIIALNDHLNADKFLLSAQTLDNDLYVYVTFNAPASIGATTVTGTMVTTAEFFTVPDTSQFTLPDTSIIQQQLFDPSYNTIVAGANPVSLTPIQGPEFLGVGLQILEAGTPDSMNAATSLVNVQLVVNGVDTIRQWSASDLIQYNYRRFGRGPLGFGWLYLDFCDDIGVPNAIGPIERKALNTESYSQVTLMVNMATGTTTGAGSAINLFKRMQSQVAA